jgi:hypothetical protein
MTRTLSLVILTAGLLPGMNLVWAQSGARDAGYLYLSPVPGAPYVSAQTRYVLVRFENVSPSDVTNLTTNFIAVTGTNSGPHAGLTHVASDGRTVIFQMSADFAPHELVTVALTPSLGSGAGGSVKSYQYQFMISGPMPEPLLRKALGAPAPPALPRETARDARGDGARETLKSANGARIMPNGVSVPDDFPEAVITVSNNPSPGYLFLRNWGQGSTFLYWMILDNSGSPVWYKREGGWYFMVQKNSLITTITDHFTGYDQNFNYVRGYWPVNGYQTDGHELKVLADGSYLILGSRDETVDMSRYVSGGVTNATVTETVIQQFTAADELIFQWRAWDHYDVRDVLGSENLTSAFTFSHMNALNMDEDGHLLVSSRELSEVTKINRDTGEMIWRLGGNNGDFVFLNDPLNGFSFQHDISALGDGRYMVFDNGNSRSPAVSRAVEYQLDLTNMTATMVWQFRDTPDKYAPTQGNAQRLPTGNTLINFVAPQYPKVIEVNSNGVKQFEMNLAPNMDHYRVFRFPWKGVVSVPYLIAEQQADDVALIFNKFGDTNVAYYRIYGGTSPQPTTLLATSTATLKHLTDLENGRRYYFRVTAVNGQSVESGYSNEEDLTVNIIKPGRNMVANGDFSQGTNSWTWTVGGSASAAWEITNGASFIDVASAGTALTDIQLRQAGLQLLRGKQYLLEFDAWAAARRPIEVRLGQNQSPWASYKIVSPSLTTATQHFSYPFVMQDTSDFDTRLIFNLGASAIDVYLDNVSLFRVAPGDFNRDRYVDFSDLAVFTSQWLQQGGGLATDLDRDGKVDFKDFGVLGADWSGP